MSFYNPTLIGCTKSQKIYHFSDVASTELIPILYLFPQLNKVHRILSSNAPTLSKTTDPGLYAGRPQRAGAHALQAKPPGSSPAAARSLGPARMNSKHQAGSNPQKKPSSGVVKNRKNCTQVINWVTHVHWASALPRKSCRHNPITSCLHTGICFQA